MNPIPPGFCQCGCGQRTKIASETHRKYGWVKGQPYRFVVGHSANKPHPPPYRGDGLCQCGCGQPTTLAKQSDRHGAVKGQPHRYLVGHARRRKSPFSESDYTIEDRGYETPCWVWKHSLDRRGYGQAMRSYGGKAKSRRAHHLAWESVGREVPSGFDLHHECEVKACVNPEHLCLMQHEAHSALHSETKSRPRNNA